MVDEGPLPFAPAAARNAAPILDVLRERLGARDHVLEIGSGTGQHAVSFASALPGTLWQPSERGENLPGLAKRLRAEGTSNVCAPVVLDVSHDAWPAGPFDACLSVNTLHIMRSSAVADLFTGAAACLRDGGQLIVYGPMVIGGEHTGDGNRVFDAALRVADRKRGIRDIDWLDRLAAAGKMVREGLVTMPADNRMVIWRRDESRFATRH